MSEIDTSGGGKGKGKGGKVRSKKASTNVDMTPMVDLGFLLITFFILATTLSKPSSMTLNVPDKSNEKEQETEPLKASKVATLFLGKNNVVHVLDGIASSEDGAKAALKDYSYGFTLREALMKARVRVDAESGKDAKGESQFVCVIKPLRGSTYKNTVDAIDEMAITKIKRYALVDALTPDETKLLGDKTKD